MLRAPCLIGAVVSLLVASVAQASAPDCLHRPLPQASSFFGRDAVWSRLRGSEDLRIACEPLPSSVCRVEARLVLEPLQGPEVELKRGSLRGLLDDGSADWFVLEDGQEVSMPEVLRVGASTTLVGRTTLRWEPRQRCSLPPPAALRHVLFERGDVDREATLPMFFDAPGAHVTVEGPVTFFRADEHTVTIEQHVDGPVLRAGGPFVAFGGSSSTDEGETFRFATRVGYELARPSWLMHSLGVETNFRGVSVVPATELAVTHSWLGTLSVGAGVPLRIAAPSAVGIRLQFGVVFPVIGFVVATDIFPGLHGPERNVVSLFGQIAL